VAQFIMMWFGFLESDYYLVMDRTNWQWGKNLAFAHFFIIKNIFPA
jgi:hypothetical protein